MQLLGTEGLYVWSYEDPFYMDDELTEAIGVVGPEVCLQRVIEHGRKDFAEGITIHAVRDEAPSVHVHELALDPTSQLSTHSAYCEGCERRTTCNDDEGVCLVCGATVMCTSCGESILNPADACPDCPDY
jgi:hypothetical protein